MDLVPYLSAIILIATIATLVLALFSYAAFKVRNSRKPRESSEEAVYFRRHRPSGAANSEDAEALAPE